MGTAPLVGRGPTRRHAWCWVGFGLLLAPAFLFAQTTDPRPADSGQAEDEAVELPPFYVTPATGWFAQDTFSGTRLRTPYKDLANQIETLTDDFLDDFALHTQADATLYTINVESRNSYAVGLGYDNAIDPGFRIRGQTGVELTRLFFVTLLPPDRFNHGRVDVSSGPNSVLSASRATAGSINTDPAPAVFENTGAVRAEFDSLGSMRFALDLNRVLVEDTLAVRGAILYADRKYDVKPSHDQDRRLYGALTYRPFRHTEIRAHYEAVDLSANRPPQSVPYDFITPWFEASSLPGSGYQENQPVFRNDQAWIEAGGNTDGQQLFQRDGDIPVQVMDDGTPDGTPSMSSWQNSVQINPLNNWSQTSPLDRSSERTLLDATHFPADTNPTGETSFRDTEGGIFNLVLNQKIFDSLFLEIAGQAESYESLNAVGTGGDPNGSIVRYDAVRVDANAFLPDGLTPNPNVGRLFIQGAPFYDAESQELNQGRITLAYEYDFAEKQDNWTRWMGRHRIVGIASAERGERKNQRRYYRIVPQVLPDGELKFPEIDGITWDSSEDSKFTTLSSARLTFRRYLDPSSGQTTFTLPFRVGEPAHVVDSTGVGFTVDPEDTGFLDAGGNRYTTADTGVPVFSGKWKEDTTIFTYQGYFWDDRIVLTYGRRDTRFDAAPFPWQAEPTTGMVLHQDDVGFFDFMFPDKGTAQVTGIVLAPFREWLDLPGRSDLSVYYQRSNSHQPKLAWHDPYGNRYPGRHGEGEDAGIRFSLADDQFAIRLNVFQVTAGPEGVPRWTDPFYSFHEALGVIEKRVRELDPTLPVLEDVPGQGFSGDKWHGYFENWLVSDSVSSGYEVSGRWVVNRNLEFRFNAIHQDVVRSDLGVEWWRWMDERLPTYQSLDVPEGGSGNDSDSNDDGTARRWTWETAPLGDGSGKTLAESWEYDVIKGKNGRDVIQSLEGENDPFIRTLRFNLNAMYRFTEGSLKGLRVGGALRWREAPFLSHGEKAVNGQPALDVDERHYGDTEWFLDLTAGYTLRPAWLGDRATTIELNVRNALDRDAPVPYLADVNGDPLRMRWVEGVRVILSFKCEL